MKLNHTELSTDTMVFLQDLLTSNYEVELLKNADGEELITVKFENGTRWNLYDLPRMFKTVLKNEGVI